MFVMFIAGDGETGQNWGYTKFFGSLANGALARALVVARAVVDDPIC